MSGNSSKRPHRIVKRLTHEELSKHIEKLMAEIDEEEEDARDFDDDSMDDYTPSENLNSSTDSVPAKTMKISEHPEESDAEEYIVLEEDNIQDDVQEEGLLFEADFEEDLDAEEEQNVLQRPGMLISKDHTEWLTLLHKQAIRTNAHNVFRDTNVGPSRSTKGLTESAIFDLIFTPAMLEQILLDTNEKAQTSFRNLNKKSAEAKKKLWINVTNIEMRAFIGLLFLGGVNKSNDEDIDMLWSSEASCYYRASMSKSRFKQILRFIRFDSQRTRATRLLEDKAAPISTIWNQMNQNLSRYYKPCGEITVDEQLFPYRGRTKFTQYIPSKPAKYGIKVWFACDAKSFYPLRSEIYVGKNPNTSRSANVGENVIKKLVSNWENTGRTIVCDNFFTSLNLGKYLLSKGLAILGTVRQNKTFVPNEMKADRKRAEYSSVFGFLDSKFALSSYVPKKGKAVVILSSTTLNNDIVAEKKNKPQYILDYNVSKGGVDAMDKMLSAYSIKRKTLRWPLAMFFNLLDISALATYIIYIENNSHIQQTDKRRKFLRSLAKQMFMPAIIERSKILRVIGYTPTRLAIEMALGHSPNSTSSASATNQFPDISEDKLPKHPVRCQACEIGNRKNTRKICSWCKKPVCDAHSTTYVFGKCCSINKT